ncbi:helix-turn-helix domain-containing protein [Nakamurella endophytica]|uniref:helix-turn-helix domain-containing protein n=1 Tax=Nakamurella endophytica TaxID=1748367 RepID=UPI0016680572|nr:XRE family transcriptional regulator [Nakamurella endophytica]
MTQDDVDELVRGRIRAIRSARGWSLDQVAGRSGLSASTLSRIETGHRRIGLDQLTAIARALGASLDELVAPGSDEDVVIKPHRDEDRGVTTWVVQEESGPHGMTVAKIRLTRPAPRGPVDALRAHPGRDWFTVLSGTAELALGPRIVTVRTGQAASFSTMVPHAFGAVGGAAEILAIFDRPGEQTHLTE